MRSLLLATALLAAPAIAGDGITADPIVDRALAGKVEGAPKNCLTRFEAERMQVRDGLALFRVNRNLVYVNDLNRCDILREDDILQTNQFGSGLCRGDIAQIIDRAGHFGRGACSFSEFVPYRTAN